jgi:Family of unknown function (DUF5996)
MENSIYKFNELDLNSWKQTFDKIHSYSQLLSDIKSKFTPHQKNWEEHSLKVYAKGLTTTSIPAIRNGSVEALDLNLNFVEHKLKIISKNERLSLDLDNYTVAQFSKVLVKILNDLGIDYKLPEGRFNENDDNSYQATAVENYWDALKQIYFILLRFKGSLLEETSNINFWPHHMDLALLVFNGKLIPGKDPKDWDNSREQMNFGFSPGDSGIPEPYFYVTAYPFPEKTISKSLPGRAYWNKEGWKGAVLSYSNLIKEEIPDKTLLEYFTLTKKLIDEERGR